MMNSMLMKKRYSKGVIQAMRMEKAIGKCLVVGNRAQ